MEPNNPDQFFISTSPAIIDGKRVIAKVKKWYDEEEKKYKERVLNTEKDRRYEE